MMHHGTIHPNDLKREKIKYEKVVKSNSPELAEGAHGLKNESNEQRIACS